MKSWAYTVLASGLGGLLVFVLALEVTLPNEIYGVSSGWLTFIIVGACWLSYLRLFIPRCSKCGLGVFSIVEVAKFPIIVKSWVGAKCFRCGEKLE